MSDYGDKDKRITGIYQDACALVPAKDYWNMDEFAAPEVSIRQLMVNEMIMSGWPIDRDDRSSGLCNVFFLSKSAGLFSGSGVMEPTDRNDLYWGGDHPPKGVRDTAVFLWNVRADPKKTMAMWILATLSDKVKEHNWNGMKTTDTQAGKLMNEARDILGEDRPSWHHRSSRFLNTSVFDYSLRLDKPVKTRELIGAALTTCIIHNDGFGLLQLQNGRRDPELAKREEVARLRARLSELESNDL